MNLSPHFTLEEMVASQEAARFGIPNAPPPEIVDRLGITCAGLEKVRDLLKNEIIISSGYRSPRLNSMIGGVPNSAHMQGYAADFISPGFGNPIEVCKAIAASDIKFDQLIFEFGQWTHISFAPMLRGQKLTIVNHAKGYSAGFPA